MREDPGFVALNESRVVGFVTLDWHNPASVEIAWLAVHAAHRRGGIGRMLVERAAAAARDGGATVLNVLTLAPSVAEKRSEDNYADTRRLYEANWFTPVREGSEPLAKSRQ